MNTQDKTHEPEIRLNLRMTLAQRDRIKRAAKKRGMSTSAFVRVSSLDAAAAVDKAS